MQALEHGGVEIHFKVLVTDDDTSNIAPAQALCDFKSCIEDLDNLSIQVCLPGTLSMKEKS